MNQEPLTPFFFVWASGKNSPNREKHSGTCETQRRRTWLLSMTLNPWHGWSWLDHKLKEMTELSVISGSWDHGLHASWPLPHITHLYPRQMTERKSRWNGAVHFSKSQICCNLTSSLFMSQCCPYGLVRFRHKIHLLRVRKRSCFS